MLAHHIQWSSLQTPPPPSTTDTPCPLLRVGNRQMTEHLPLQPSRKLLWDLSHDMSDVPPQEEVIQQACSWYPELLWVLIVDVAVVRERQLELQFNGAYGPYHIFCRYNSSLLAGGIPRLKRLTEPSTSGHTLKPPTTTLAPKSETVLITGPILAYPRYTLRHSSVGSPPSSLLLVLGQIFGKEMNPSLKEARTGFTRCPPWT